MYEGKQRKKMGFQLRQKSIFILAKGVIQLVRQKEWIHFKNTRNKK